MHHNTEKNLLAAFAGESQANRKYLAFAKKAEEEGLEGVAKLFKAAAAAETVHAHNHLGVVGGVKSTLENLKAAFDGEHHEFTSMYPEFIATAKEEKQNEAFKSFHWANEVEKVHGGLYRAAIEAVEAGAGLPAKDYFVCDKCGMTVADAAPDKCPVCSAAKEAFFKVD
ncbi:MAG: rubrerythrin family protein [Pseudomonadota bacterium]